MKKSNKDNSERQENLDQYNSILISAIGELYEESLKKLIPASLSSWSKCNLISLE